MQRHPANPVITRLQIPDHSPHLCDVSAVFNPGAVQLQGETILLLRVQNRGRETYTLTARSCDGIHFSVTTPEIALRGIDKIKERIFHCYDMRITPLDGRYYLMFAMDMEGGCRLGLAVTRDFTSFDFLGITSGDDTRNGVLFPERVDGLYLRLERPNRVQLDHGPASGNTIVLAASPDLLTWSPVGDVASGRFHYWDELIGSGPPPIKTRAGWLALYHGVATHFASSNIYQAGVMLLDLQDPCKLLARSRYNILEPRESWELSGQVPNVVFPSGLIVEEYDDQGFARFDSPFRLYYGAADTVVGLVTGRVAELIEAATA
ncbi:MAG TPA: glycoside hydrolase family 130 protein [bacterium]|nr:glycoside hydrolase family 130 protein [bacterium]HPR88059.1 glycoside hydrolase family 130 protein [bacterium]